MTTDTYNTLTIILAAISTIVSIAGWTVTYKRQKEILERQIIAGIQKEKISVSLSLTLAELEKVRKWVNMGFKLLNLARNLKDSDDKSRLIKMEKDWALDRIDILTREALDQPIPDYKF